MEEWHPTDENESKDEKKSAKKKRSAALSTFMKFLEDMRRGPERDKDEEEDDDEESDGTKRSSKFGKFLRRLLTKESGSKTAETEPASPLATGAEQAVEPAEQAVDQENNVAEPEGYQGELVVDHPRQEGPKPLIEEAPALLKETPKPFRKAEKAASNKPQDQETMVSVPEQLYQPIIPNLERQQYQAATAETQVSEQNRYESTSRPESPEAVVEQRSSNVLPLVALEYIGRRRGDRKLRKQTERLEKQVLRTQKARERFEQHAARQMEQVAALQQRQARYETILPPEETYQRLERLESSPSSRPEVFIPKQRKPEQRETVPATKRSFEQSERVTIPDTDRLAERHTNPEVVLEQVARAAEYDMPLEKTYERRQEVRDEPGAGVPSGGLQPIGAVMAASQAHAQLIESQKRAAAAVSTGGLPRYQEPRQTRGLYRQAATAGIVAAAVIIVLGLLGLLLLR